ncbi:hypothetical protein GCM10009872_16270 [Actinopolymorpha rutila]
MILCATEITMCHEDGEPRMAAQRVLAEVIPCDLVWHNELFRPRGSRTQLGIVTRYQKSRYATGWALVRARRDFTDAEVKLAATLAKAGTRRTQAAGPT